MLPTHLFSSLEAVSPLDGRYCRQTAALSAWFSEAALTRYRVQVEIHWFLGLFSMDLPQMPVLSLAAQKFLLQIIEHFDLAAAQEINHLEKTINHDVKAVEYWLKAQMKQNDELASLVEWVHFACTSEDINNIAYGLMIKGAATQVLYPQITEILEILCRFANDYAAHAMLAHTHGQAASPTTVGKEFANFAVRVQCALAHLQSVTLKGKLNGAVGNYHAHYIAYPEFDWEAFSKKIVEQLGLTFNTHTTQIEPHDSLAQWFDALARLNTILIDLCRDLWGYIALAYFKQKVNPQEVGSSTMPHKINPIDFEQAEGNLGLANALFAHFSSKLPISRWQRDLSDSTVLRNIGVALGYSMIAYHACMRGLNKLHINEYALAQDLAPHWELLAEAVQTVMRRYGLPDPYQQLKALTRGKALTQQQLHHFIKQLDIPETAKIQLLALTPQTYLGKAEDLARRIKTQSD